MQAIRLKRQVQEQRFEIREKSANIEKTDIRQSDVRGENISILSYFLTYSILLSTSRRLVPLSLQRGKRFAGFPVSPQSGINYPPSGEPDYQTEKTGLRAEV